ncbi:MAG: hypothetical protein H8E61_06960 [Bacteroidetes bacterium]|nr:hypothetical protein [Bacteroidota bacterium]
MKINKTLHYWIISIIIMAIFAAVIILRIKYFSLLNLISIILYTGFCLLIPEQVVFSKNRFRIFKISVEFNQVFDLLASAILVAILFLGANRTFFDDVGFTLRYMDNFKQGYFYCFNPGDGPVFGISGFLNTLFCGMIAYLKIINPHNTLLLSNVLGIFAISFLSFRILRILTQKAYMLLLAWFLLLFCVKNLINVAFSGIETPFHLAIILTAIYFFLKDNAKGMWLFLALSVISKLDAAPIAFVIGIMFLLKNKQELKRLSIKNRFYSRLFYWGLIPLLIWLIFMTAVFGSPLPQSAFAKINFYPHPQTSWFPFLTGYISDHYLYPVFILFFIVFAIHQLVVILRPKQYPSFVLIFGYGFLASLVMYYFFNPGEKMMWYYTVPSFFMFFQIALSLIKLIPAYGNKYLNPLLVLLFVGLFIFLRNDISASNIWLKKNMNVTENERILIGEYLGDISKATDSLLSKHGHLSRYFKGYVIDNSGLNSTLATDYKLNTDSLISAFNPGYVINHGWDNYLEVMNKHNYRLIDAFYDLSLYGSPNWMLFERLEQSNKTNYSIVAIPAAQISGIEKKFDLRHVTRINGYNLKIHANSLEDKESKSPKIGSRLILGIIKHQVEFDIRINTFLYGYYIESRTFKVQKIGSGISRFVQTVELSLQPNDINDCEFEIYRPDGERVAIINPYIEYSIKD